MICEAQKSEADLAPRIQCFFSIYLLKINTNELFLAKSARSAHFFKAYFGIFFSKSRPRSGWRKKLRYFQQKLKENCGREAGADLFLAIIFSKFREVKFRFIFSIFPETFKTTMIITSFRPIITMIVWTARGGLLRME